MNDPAQYNPNTGTGTYPPLAILGMVGGNYPLHPAIPNALASSYLNYAVPESATKLLLSGSPQELFAGDVFSAQLMFRPKIAKATVNRGSEGGSIARGAVSL